jgi:hypothetical protein
MGMDLITIGFTVTPNPTPKDDPEALTGIIRALSDDWLTDHLDNIDPQENYEDMADLRAAIVNGAGDYEMHRSGMHRYGAFYEINGTPRYFIIAGGSSWGDDPYEDWSDLTLFINACELLPDLAMAAGYCGAGICP